MNYIGTHNLNLIGKVAFVLGASTTTGAAIARAILNSNAFVLGLDVGTAHDSTRSARGSHFQFLSVGSAGKVDWGKAMRYSRDMFWKDEVDFLVLVLGGDSERADVNVGEIEDVLRVMEQRGEGAVLVVCGAESGVEEVVIEQARKVQKQLSKRGVRCNAILPAGSFLVEEKIPAIAELQEHIDQHSLKRKEGGYAVEYAREVANVALFLCTGMGGNVDGTVVGSDGIFGSL